MRVEDLCQLCGTPRTDIVYVLAPVDQVSTMVEMYGGAVCPLRCGRLTVAVCPHYTTVGSPIAIYAVPRHNGWIWSAATWTTTTSTTSLVLIPSAW